MFGSAKPKTRTIKQRYSSMASYGEIEETSTVSVPVRDEEPEGSLNDALYINPDVSDDSRKCKAGEVLFQAMFGSPVSDLVGEEKKEEFAAALFDEYVASSSGGLLNIAYVNAIVQRDAFATLLSHKDEISPRAVCDYIFTMALFPSKVSLDNMSYGRSVEALVTPDTESLFDVSSQINDMPLNVISEILNIEDVPEHLESGADVLQEIYDSVEKVSVEPIKDVVLNKNDIRGKDKSRHVLSLSFFEGEDGGVPSEIELVPVLALNARSKGKSSDSYFLDYVSRSTASEDVYFVRHSVICNFA